MAKIRLWSVGIALAGLLAAGAGPARAAQDTLKVLLPPDGAAPGWTRDGEPQEYAGEDLYVYINGGAEIYQEYGFRRVVVQDYKNAAGKPLSLEIFEMETPAAAYGMFTFKRSGLGRVIQIGSGAELEDYYLNFWKGQCLATLTGFDESAETVAGLLAVGRQVDARIEGPGDSPELVAALPGEGLRPGSIKYLRGLLGLNNVYPLHTARGLAFAEAVKGDYGEGSFLMVMDYGSDGSCAAAWRDLRAALESSDRFRKSGNAAGEIVLFRDAQERFVAFSPSGSRLVFAVSPGADAAIELARRAAR